MFLLPMESKVEFKLKFLLNSLSLKVLNVQDVSDPKKITSFNGRFCDSKKIQAFCSEISEISVFPMLNVPLTPNSKIHKACFCEVAVGKSLFVTNEYAQTLDLPNGCDSFIVTQEDAKGLLINSEIDISKFSYVLKDASRVLPLYEVTFEYDEEFEKLSRKSFICHKCTKAQAVMFCPSERASFCGRCDEQMHNDHFLKRHRRLYFSEVGQKKFICCSQHPTRIVEYFCETCMEPLCADCKITGSHSDREKYDHQIVSFLDACRMLKSRLLECTKPMDDLVENCEREIGRFKIKASTFRDNIVAVRKQLEKEFKDLLLQLDEIESSQRQIMNTNYVERVAVESLIRRVKSYPHELDPADLLFDFNSIQELIDHESKLVFGKFEPKKIELQGKITLSAPKESTQRLPISNSEDKTIRWRIETMHMSKEADSSIY